MKLGIHFGDFTLPGEPESLGEVLTATAKAAEDGGCAVFTLMDHYFQMAAISRAEDPMLEGYTSLGFLAGRTERIRLGLLVSGVTYRHPGLLVKIVTTLDVLSGGRAQFGLGAAWYEREHLGLGVPFPPLRSGSSGSRRRCRSPCRCGATTTDRTTAGTTSSPRRSARRPRSSARGPGS